MKLKQIGLINCAICIRDYFNRNNIYWSVGKVREGKDWYGRV